MAEGNKDNVLRAMEVFDKKIALLTKLHTFVLGSWAFMNIVSGIYSLNSSGYYSYFCIMNLCWGLINVVIAIFVYFHNQRSILKPKTLLHQLDRQRHVEKVLLLNIGLDVAYVIGGVAMWQHGLIRDITYDELWKGFGFSAIMQGSFLFFQDYIFYRLHAANRNKAYSTWQQMMEGI